MSLTGALNIGKSALAVSQAAIQTTSNNIANVGTNGYTRQVNNLAASRDQQLKPGQFVGTGVELTSIQRQIDEALESRIRASVSDDEAAKLTEQWIGRIESVFNELTDEDLSTKLSTFFNGWSELANKPQDLGLRQVVLQNGQNLSEWFQTVRTGLSQMQSDVDDRLTALANDADTLATKVAELNRQISRAEGGMGSANNLRDQRDAVLKQLSSLMDIRTQQRENGTIDVYVGSEPLVVGDASRGVALKQDTVDGRVVSTVIFKKTGGAMKLDGRGQIGALADVRTQLVSTTKQLDDNAGALIFELNKVHASGQGLELATNVGSTHAVTDITAALNDDKSGLKFKAANGSFVVNVKDAASGRISATLIDVDLDGLGADTSLASLAGQLDAVDGLTASAAGGKLIVKTDNGKLVSFAQDSSGVLAALGVNNFFGGSDAGDIAVSTTLLERPQLLAASKNGEPADNGTAKAIAELQTKAIASLKGQSLKGQYESMINDVAAKAATAKNASDAATAVRETLETQRENLSGVSLDEEAINLMKYQRAYQGAAKVIATVDELLQTLMGIL
jgi:flagellar hook-associated protein 1